jgi:hypothetical protein
MKRIVEETLANGKKQYRVQSNKRFFGLISCDWYTIDIPVGGIGWDAMVPAVVNNLEFAQRIAFGKTSGEKVIETKIIKSL